MRIGSLLLACVAAAASAWFVIGARQAHESDAATVILSKPNRTPRELAHAQRLITAAGFLYPGQDINNLRSQQLLAQRRYAAAERTIVKVIRAEPQNLRGWFNLTALSLLRPQLRQRAGVTRAELSAHLAALDPIDLGRR